MRKTYLAALVIALAGIGLAAWLVWSGPDEKAARANVPMRVATYYWPGMYWIDVAREKGWFREAGIDAEFIDYDNDYYAGIDDLQQGEVDTLAVWLFDIVKRSREGERLVMALATDESRGSEGIVSRPGIQSMEELRGQRIGVPLGTALVYELDVMLANFGLGLEEVTLVDMRAEKAQAALAQGDLAAVITWEPYLSEAATEGRRLYDSGDMPGLITAGMTFRESFVKNRPDTIRRMVDVWHRATRFIHRNRNEAYSIVAEHHDVRVEDVAQFAQRNRILTLRDNLEAFTYGSGLESLFGSARKINRFLLERENGEGSRIDGAKLLDGTFVRALAQEEQVGF